MYYVFNYAFNIQLIFNIQHAIEYSTSHSTFNYSFYIQFLFYPFNYLLNNFNHLFNIQLKFLKHSTTGIHSTFNFNWTFNYSFNIQLFIQHSTIHSTLLRRRTDQISQTKVDNEIVEQHIVVVDETVRLLCIPRYTPRQQFEY